jgi:DNA-binding transcriptional MocR family regulator
MDKIDCDMSFTMPFRRSSSERTVKDALLSEYGRLSAAPSPVNRMMAAFAADFRDGYDINLGVGYVNEGTIPDRGVLEAIEYVLAHPERHRLALNYGGPKGSQNLIDSIRAFYVRDRIGGLDEATLARQEILIGPSGATSILDGLSDVLKPGIVLTSDPMYYIYCNALERKGFEVVTVPEDDDGIDTDALENTIRALGSRREHLAFVYVVTVGNPTSTILSNKRREKLVETVSDLSGKLGRKVPLVFDQAYEFLIHDPQAETPQSALRYDTCGIVHEVGTLSKILAPALRIGYLIGPDSPTVKALVQRTSDVGFSAPLITQEVASYLLDHHIAEQRVRVNRGYREKAVRAGRWIRERLGPVLAGYSGGRAGFYFYLTFQKIHTVEQSPFFHYLARTTGDARIDGPPGNKNPRVVYVPGQFCVHPRGTMAELGKRQLRLSYGYEELERIENALSLMAEAAVYAEAH